jgi:hypothetical protein
MQKPKIDAPEGWYESPVREGYEQYWAGKYWADRRREIGGEEINQWVVMTPGNFLFNRPYQSDLFFRIWFGLAAILLISLEGTLQARGWFHSGIASIFIAFGDFLFFVLVAPWLLLSPFLLIRRKRSKRPNTTS